MSSSAGKEGVVDAFGATTVYLEESSLTTNGSGVVEVDVDDFSIIDGTTTPKRGLNGLDLWFTPSGGETVSIEVAGDENAAASGWQEVATYKNVTGGLQRLYVGEVGGNFLRFKSTAEGGTLRAFLSPKPPADGPVDAGSDEASSSLADSGTLEVTLYADAGQELIVVGESDEDFILEADHNRDGITVTQQSDSGTIAGPGSDGQIFKTPGAEVVARLQDKSSDGGNNATASLIAKVV